jgi:hypothetical protein
MGSCSFLLCFLIIIQQSQREPITMAARSKPLIVFARSSTGIGGSNPMHICVLLFCVGVVLCVKASKTHKGCGAIDGWMGEKKTDRQIRSTRVSHDTPIYTRLTDVNTSDTQVYCALSRACAHKSTQCHSPQSPDFEQSPS